MRHIGHASLIAVSIGNGLVAHTRGVGRLHDGVEREATAGIQADLDAVLGQER